MSGLWSQSDTCHVLAGSLQADLFFSHMTLANIMLSGSHLIDECSVYLTGFDVAAMDFEPPGVSGSEANEAKRFDSRSTALDLGRVMYGVLSTRAIVDDVDAMQLSSGAALETLMEVPASAFTVLQGLLRPRPSTRLSVRLAAAELQSLQHEGGRLNGNRVEVSAEEEVWWRAVEEVDDSDGGTHECKESRSRDDVDAALVRACLALGGYWDKCNKTYRALELYGDAIEHAARAGGALKELLSEAYGRLADSCIRSGRHDMARDVLELLRGLEEDELRRLGAGSAAGNKEGGADGALTQERGLRLRLAATCDLLGLTSLALGEKEGAMGQEARSTQELQRALREFGRAEKELSVVGTEEATAQLWKVRAHKAAVYRIRGHYDHALRGYEEALDARRKVLSKNDPEIATYLVSMGRVFAKKGEADVAVDLLGKAHDKLMAALHEPNTPKPDPLLIADTRTRLGDLCRLQKKPQESLGWYQLALEVKEATLPACHPELASSYHAIGLFFEDNNEAANAAVVYKKALKIRRVALPPDAPETAATLHRLAVVAFMLKEHSASMTYFQEAQAILSKWGPSTELADVLWSIASLRQAEGDLPGALSTLLSAQNVYRRMELKPDDQRVQALTRRIDTLRAKQGLPATKHMPNGTVVSLPQRTLSREARMELNAARIEKQQRQVPQGLENEPCCAVQ